MVQPGKPDAFYTRLTGLAASGELRLDRRGHLAGRQPAGGVPVSRQIGGGRWAARRWAVGEQRTATNEIDDTTMTTRASTNTTTRPAAPSLLTASLRIFDLSLGEMLWSRRSVFLALVVGGPVLIALICQTVEFFNLPALRVNGVRVSGAVMFGGIIWAFYLRVIVPLLGVFYGTSLMADEVEDRTLTYLFTRPIPRGAVLIGKYLAYLACAGPDRAAVRDAGVLSGDAARRRRAAGHCARAPGSAQGPGPAWARSRRLRSGLRVHRRSVEAPPTGRPLLHRGLGNRRPVAARL